MSYAYKGMALKPEYEEEYENWLFTMSDRGCTCFSNPPCCYCTHEGNPSNLIEDDNAWESQVKAAVRQVVEDGETHQFDEIIIY